MSVTVLEGTMTVDWLARARLYGQAVQVLDECLGEDLRIAVMERFSQMAGPLQRRRLKDPWEMIAHSALAAGVPKPAVEALRLVYLMRTGQWKKAADWPGNPSEPVWEYLRLWGVLSEFEAKRKRRR